MITTDITRFGIHEKDDGWAFTTEYGTRMVYNGGGFGSALDAAHAALVGMGNIHALPLAVEWLTDSIDPHGDPGGLLALAMLLRYAETHVAADYRAQITEHFTTRDRGIVGKELGCYDCDSTFADADELRNHEMATNHGPTPFHIARIYHTKQRHHHGLPGTGQPDYTLPHRPHLPHQTSNDPRPS